MRTLNSYAFGNNIVIVFRRELFNVWDNCEDENHAIHLSIPFNLIFLMREDVVHGSALDNVENGAPWIHFYFLTAIKQRNGNSVAKLKRQDNNMHTDGSSVVITRNFIIISAT